MKEQIEEDNQQRRCGMPSGRCETLSSGSGQLIIIVIYHPSIGLPERHRRSPLAIESLT